MRICEFLTQNGPRYVVCDLDQMSGFVTIGSGDRTVSFRLSLGEVDEFGHALQKLGAQLQEHVRLQLQPVEREKELIER